MAGVLLASACGGGGGGGGGGSSSSSATTAPQGCVQTASHGCISAREYRQRRQTLESDHRTTADFDNQWGLTAIRADRAYAQLALHRGGNVQPGAGQTVGLIDSGIDTDHPVFAGKTVSETFLSGATDEMGDRPSHGTAVASVLAGRPSSAITLAVKAPRGVAPGADIAMFAIPLGSGVSTYTPISLSGLSSLDDTVESWIDTVTSWSSGGRTLDFMNLSIGFLGIIEQYSTAELRANFADAIATLARAGSGEKTIFVWAAGNANEKECVSTDFTGNRDLCVNNSVVAKSPDILAGLPARIPELRGHLVAVVAVRKNDDDTYEIADFSNRCGIAAEWCIAAPGEGVRFAYFGPDPDDGTSGARGAATDDGTSFAAPMVAGGLALMKTYFRGQLSNTALVTRLLATANRTGVFATRSIYGQGLLDLGAATAPVGVVGVARGDRVDGPGDAVAGTRFVAGGALGDGLTRAFAGGEIAAFDSLGAPFWFGLGGLAGAAPRASAASRLRRFAAAGKEAAPAPLAPRFAALTPGRHAGPVLGVMRTRPGYGHLSLAAGALALRAEDGDGLGIAAFSTEGLDGRPPASGAALSWQPEGAPLGLVGGWMSERETALGSAASGAFGRLSGNAAFAGLRGRARIGAWRVAATAEIGGTRAAAQGGMIARVSPLATSAFAVHAERALANGDRLELGLAQPLRVEAGRARLSLPVGRSKDGRVLRRGLSAGLEPSGRDMGATIRWRRSLAAAGELSLGAGWTRQPGHDAAAAPDLDLLAAWRLAF